MFRIPFKLGMQKRRITSRLFSMKSTVEYIKSTRTEIRSRQERKLDLDKNGNWKSTRTEIRSRQERKLISTIKINVYINYDNKRLT